MTSTSTLLSAHRRRQPAAMWCFLTALTVLVVLGVAPTMASDDATQRVIGAGGVLYELHAGAYGDLFDGPALDGAAQVLALDVRRGDAVERLLVPGTESASAEVSASMIYDNGSETVYLLWEGLAGGVHPLLHLVTFGNDGFGVVSEITASPFSDKGHPQLAVTRESATASEAADRVTAHLAWWEQSGADVRPVYTPLVLDGVSSEWKVLLDLPTLLPAAESAAPVDPALGELLHIVPGRSTASALVAFVDAAHGRLATVEVEALPSALTGLANAVASHVRSLPDGVDVDTLLSEVTAIVEADGGDFHPATVAWLLVEVERLLRSEGPSASFALARKLGGHIIHIGYKVGSAGLVNPDADAIFAIGPSRTPLHHFKRSVVSIWELPAVGADPTLFASRDGGSAVLAWAAEGAVLYRETDGGGWTDVRTIELGAHLDRAAALEALQRRVLAR
ncbi:MAG: hypothetical protein AAGN46_12490 [Acidobacteriota bacterium]